MADKITNTADLLDALKALPRSRSLTMADGRVVQTPTYVVADELDALLARYQPPKSVPKRPKRGPSRGKDYWRTPPELLEVITELLAGVIQLDPCASPDKAHHFATENLTETGLLVPWGGRTYINPPYSKIGPWVRKGREHWDACGHDASVFSALYLIPPSVDSAYWADCFLDSPAERGANFYATRKGRVQFWGDDGPIKGNTKGSAIIGWLRDPDLAAETLRKDPAWRVERPKP